MALIPCPNQVDCPGSDFPITNYSAEGPEQQPTFFSLVFPPEWNKPGCLSLCYSEISQNDADLCALAQEASCNPDPPAQIFCNVATTCSCVSANGSEFFYTVPAGTFCAETQAAADALAQSYCHAHCSNPETSVVLRGVDACACNGEAYLSQVSFSGSRPVAWTLISGTLPDGVGLNPSTGELSGTLTATGVFDFTVRAYTSSGNYAEANYRITVLQITNASLPDYTLGVPYSEQLTASGGSGNYVWKLASGTLPEGVALSAVGLLSGTPTALGSDSVRFQVADMQCESVNKTYFPPRVAIVSTSTAIRATTLGYDQWPGFSTLPPKRYKKLSWSGSLTQTVIAVTPSDGHPQFPTPEQRLAKLLAISATIDNLVYEWSDAGEISNTGSRISNYTKCLLERIVTPPDGTPYTVPADCSLASGTPLLDQSPVAPLISSSGTDAARSETFELVYTVWSLLQDSILLYELAWPGNPSHVLPYNLGTITVRIVSGYAAVMTDEYTDAIALANASVTSGGGRVAANFPRTTGFVSSFISVQFTLRFSNLLLGENYVAVALFVQDDGTEISRAYAFTASGTTHTVTDSVPTPDAGQTMRLRAANVNFAST